MAASFGVHFGTTCACIAVCRDGKVDVVANDSGDRTTPAVVAFTNHDQAVGLAAKQGIIRNAENTVCNVKKILGKSFEDALVQDVCSSSSVKIINKNGQPKYEVEYKEKTCVYEPVQIAAVIYKKMMQTAESAGGLADSHDAVLTVPLNFNETQKQYMCEAATEAGFNVMRIISEPVAAALAYEIGMNDPNEICNVLVYRLGGSSLDVTVLNVNSGMYRVLASIQNNSLGGHQTNKILTEYLAGEFKRQWKVNCLENKRSVAKLNNACENCKHVLSTMGSAHVSVESLYDGIDLQSTVSRARFEGLCSPFFQQCLQYFDVILKSAKLDKSDIHKVVVCGGTTKIPQLQQLIGKYFDNAELLNKLDPDEVIARGAAIQAALLCGNDEKEMEENARSTEVAALSRDILIETSDENNQYEVILPKFTPMPTRKQKKFHLQSEQNNFSMLVLQSTDDKPQPMAKVVLRDLPAGCQVNTVFHGKSDGSLHITCCEPTSNKSSDVTIESS